MSFLKNSVKRISRIFTSSIERVVRSFVPRVTQYMIRPSVLRKMRSFALQTHPKEMISLLRGRHEGDTLIIEELVYQPFENTTYSATIHLDPTLTGIVGTFHSHPTPDARPSAADKRLFAQHPGVHVIIGYPYEEAHVYTHRSRFLAIERVPRERGSTVVVSRRGGREERRLRREAR